MDYFEGLDQASSSEGGAPDATTDEAVEDIEEREIGDEGKDRREDVDQNVDPRDDQGFLGESAVEDDEQEVSERRKNVSELISIPAGIVASCSATEESGNPYTRRDNQASPHAYHLKILRSASFFPLIRADAMATPRMTMKQRQTNAKLAAT